MTFKFLICCLHHCVTELVNLRDLLWNYTARMNLLVAFSYILLTGFTLAASEIIAVEKSSGHNPSGNRGARPLTKSAYQGGAGGRQFDDIASFQHFPYAIVSVRSITISHTDTVNSIQVNYVLSRRDFWGRNVLSHGRQHGIPRGQWTKISLDPLEHIVRVEGQTDGKHVNQLAITTADGSRTPTEKTYGPFGKNSSDSFSFDGNIVGFFGATKFLQLNGIGVYSIDFLKKGDAVGGTGGKPFDDNTEILSPVPAFIGISQITIWSGHTVEALQVIYFMQGFDYYGARQHGVQQGGNLTTIDFVDGEKLTTIEGTTNEDYICQLTFITKKPDGSERKYGPFGEAGSYPFSISENIIVLHGTSGTQLNTIGAYYV